jgi:hypothetical protein
VALAGTAIVGAVAFREVVIAIFNCRTGMPGDAGHFHQRERRHTAAATSIGSIKVASSASAFELLTRFETGQRCR